MSLVEITRKVTRIFDLNINSRAERLLTRITVSGRISRLVACSRNTDLNKYNKSRRLPSFPVVLNSQQQSTAVTSCWVFKSSTFSVMWRLPGRNIEEDGSPRNDTSWFSSASKTWDNTISQINTPKNLKVTKFCTWV